MTQLRLIILTLLLLPMFAFSQSIVTLEQHSIEWSLERDEVVENWNRSFPAYENLTEEEKEIFYWTNYSRRNPARFWDSVVFPLLNIYPQLTGKYAASLKADLYQAGSLPMYSLNETLNSTAKSHALDITNTATNVSHTSSNGTSFSERLQNAGIKYCGSENMSLGNGDVLLSLALLYLDIGLEDLGHRKTLLSKDYVEIGIGSTKLGLQQTFFVQDFSCRQQ